MNGWIKIHRRLLEWEHFGEPSVVTVYLALLLSADKDGKTDITNGVVSALTGLSHNTVGNSISKLVKSGEISREKYGSKITTTIINWSEYQGRASTQILGDNQKPLTQKFGVYNTKKRVDIDPKNGTIQYNKNNKNNKNNIVVANAHARAHEDFLADALTDLRVEQGCMAMRITPDQYRQLVNEVVNDWEFRSIPDNEWTLTHLLAQMRIKHNINNRNNGHDQNTGNAGDQRSRIMQDGLRAMAALAAESRQPTDAPF